MNSKISIIIPFIGKGPIKGCIESIKKQSYKNYEIILVDDNMRSGPGAARNRGVKKSKGDILLFLDYDATLEKDFLQKIVDCFKKHETDAVTGIPLAPADSTLLDYIVGLEYEDRFLNMGEGFVNIAATTCLAVKRNVFEGVRGFTEEFKKAIGEDWDFSMRLKENGFKIWHTNNAKIYHYTTISFWKYFEKQFDHAKYRVRHFFKFKNATDEYTNPFMVLQSFLWLLIPFTYLFPYMFPVIVGLVFFWNTPLLFRILSKTKSLNAFLILPISFIRSLYWISGAIYGFLELIFFTFVGKKVS